MNIKIDIGEILSKSWKITWKFKVLWIFGILSGCVASNRGNFNFNNGGSNGGGNGGNGQFPDFPGQFPTLQIEEAIRQFLNQYVGIIIGVCALLCVLWLLFYFLGMMGRIGLIKGAGKADAGAETLTFGELWTESLPYFWRMFGLTFLVGFPAFLVTILLLVALGVGGYAAFTGSVPQNSLIVMLIGGVGAFVLVMCCLSLVMLVVGLIVEQSYNAIVLEDRRLLESLGRGWEVFSKNWLSVVVVGVIQWVVRLVFGIVEVIVDLILAAPLIITGIIAIANRTSFNADALGKGMLFGLVLTVCCTLAILIPLSLLVNGVLLTYLQTMWTLAYRRMTELMKPALPAQVEVIEPQ
jgi:hypothetical protein